MGNTRVRARLRRALSTLALVAAIVAGPVLAAPAGPAAAASVITVHTHRALTGETPSPRTEVSDSSEITPAHLAIGGLSAAVLLAVVGGLVLDVRRRHPSRRSRMPGA